MATKQKTLALLTIGQSPRVDLTGDVLSRLPDDIRIVEYGALDPYTLEEVTARFSPKEGDEVLVSRMRDGRQAKFAGRCVNPLLQACIEKAEGEGADAILLLCTGEFPQFTHRVPLLAPQKLFQFTAAQWADGGTVAVIVPDRDQVHDAQKRWSCGGVKPIITYASPYGPLSAIEQAAKSLQGSGAAFVCLDCMGFSQHMKARVAALSGLPVLLPRTLAACAAAELLSEEERPPRTAQTAK